MASSDEDELLSINGDSDTEHDDNSIHTHTPQLIPKPSTSKVDTIICSKDKVLSSHFSSDEDELLSIDGDSDHEHDDNSIYKHKPGLIPKPSVSEADTIKCSSDIVHKITQGDRNSPADDDGISTDDDENDNDNSSSEKEPENDSIVVRSHHPNEPAEVMLTDESDDDENAGNGHGQGSRATGSAEQSNVTGANEQNNRYGLRRKRKINYHELENAPEMATMPDDRKKSKVLDIFSLSDSKLSKFIQNPDSIDDFTVCKVVFMDGTNSSRFRKVTEFFDRCGHQFESMFIHIRHNEENYPFLKNIFKSSKALGKLDYRYQNQDDAFELLKLLKSLRQTSSLPSLSSLKLISDSGYSGSHALQERHLTLLSEMSIQFHNVELGDSLWEDVKPKTLEKFLENQKTCLETFIIQGGFRGEVTPEEKPMISFPKMEALKTLCICPKYTFLSEVKNPHSKKARIISIDVAKKEEPFKIGIKFSSPELPKLQRLVLGNMIDIEDLLFSTVRKLTEFRCGSYWNLAINFPSEFSRKSLMESSVTDFQFPDCLKDPIFTVKVAKHFPYLKKVWLSLPSVPVLRAFFKAFENSNLEELYLKTQFDFEKTMESCLLPKMKDVLQKSQETETIIRTLREYKHFDEYIKYYNVELPVEQEDLMESHSAGIGALKNLKILHLEHIPRTLLIPIPDDERKWYDHNCKFMSSTFGYERYPLNYKCHQEILKLDLNEYIWKNIQIRNEFTEDFYQAGFVDIPDIKVIGEQAPGTGACNSDDDDLFIPIHKSSPSGTQVKIMPSMLFPSVKAKPEGL